MFNVVVVVIQKLYSSNLLLDVQMQKWLSFMCVVIEVVVTVGQSKSSVYMYFVYNSYLLTVK